VFRFLKGVAFVGFRHFGITLPFGNPAHGQVHTHFGTFAVKVGPEIVQDILFHAFGNANHMLGGKTALGGLLFKFGRGSLAGGAKLGGLIPGKHVAADRTYPFLHHNTSLKKIFFVFKKNKPNFPKPLFAFPVPAIPAEAVKYGFPVIHGKTAGFRAGGGILHPGKIGFRTGKIHHPAAPGTDQVGVGLHNAVKTFFPVYHPHGRNQPLMKEDIDVPVYRPQGQVRNEGFEFIVYPLGAGMLRGGLNHLQNGVPFIAVFSFFTHHKYKTIIIIIINIVKGFFEFLHDFLKNGVHLFLARGRNSAIRSYRDCKNQAMR
jgi:hypothetical protein